MEEIWQKLIKLLISILKMRKGLRMIFISGGKLLKVKSLIFVCFNSKNKD